MNNHENADKWLLRGPANKVELVEGCKKGDMAKMLSW